MTAPAATHAPTRLRTVSREAVDILKRGGTFADVRHLVSGACGRTVYETGDLEAGIWWIGTSMCLIDDIPAVGELVTRIVDEAQDLITGRLAGMLTGATAAVAS